MNDLTIKDIFYTIPKRFRKEKAGNDSGTFHFDFSKDDGGHFTVIIENQTCRVEEGLIGEPDCLVRTKAAIYIKVELGKTNPQTALLFGKIKVSNLTEMMRFSKYFRKFKMEYLQEETETQEVNWNKTERPTKNGPLKGIKILDLTRLLPGPLATQLMGDLGAEVIKIEDPDDPDYARNFPPFMGEESANYLAVNRNKKNLALNLRSEAGKKVFFKLVQSADVVIEQYRPGILDKWGIGYETANEINPKIIYASISGYGQTGSYANKAGHDINYIGYSGILGTSVDDNGTPTIPSTQIGDIAGGSYMAVIGILSAINQRHQTQKGDHVDISMTDAALPLMSLPLNHYWANQEAKKGEQLFLSGGFANYRVYKCKDDRFIALGALEPKFWDRYCEAISREDLKSRIIDQSAENHAALKEELNRIFIQKTREEWMNEFEAIDMCVSPILGLDEIENDKHLQERGMITTVEHPTLGTIKAIGCPLKFKSNSDNNNWAAPTLGADTYNVLSNSGLSDNEINSLKNDGIIA